MNINRTQIIEGIIRVIDHISDKNYQRKVWILGVGPELDDFDETVCNFIGPAEDVINHYKDYNLTEFQTQILKRFHNSFVKFSKKNDFPEIFLIQQNGSK